MSLHAFRNVGFAGLLFLLIGQAHAAVFITEFMADSVDPGDSEGEYIEIYNTGAPFSVADVTLKSSGAVISPFESISSEMIGTNSFFVFAGSRGLDFEDVVWDENFGLGDKGDTIVIELKVNGSFTEVARVDYADGDIFGDGVAHVLEDIFASTPKYIAEIAANDTISGSDIGSPGVAGSTNVTPSAVPEPVALATGVLGLGMLLRRDAGRWSAG